ncbi:MAG: DUF1624 domain-containing protein [Aestuariibacter sp.]
MSDTSHRLNAIDQLRGLVIVIMGLDHVRDFFSPFAYQPEDLGQTSPELFFTRWITHFCAPVFVFLTGMSAFLFEQKVNDKTELRNFLLSRGLWLIFIELVVVNTSWKFAFLPWFFIQVIWVLGISMIILAGLIYLPKKVLGAVSVVIIVGHNLLDPIQASTFGDWGWLWGLLHQNMWVPFNAQGAGLYIAYPIIPWFAVMALGYAISGWLTENKNLLIARSFWLGLLLFIGFIVLRLLNLYGDPQPWAEQERGAIYTFISFLNTVKYPPSLLFLLMTLGPALMLLSWLQKMTEKPGVEGALRPLLLFGRVPFFYYVVHVPLIHGLAVLLFIITINAPVGWQMQGPNAFPQGYQPDMYRLYGAWIVVTGIMYFACRWYAGFKTRHQHWLLRYL